MLHSTQPIADAQKLCVSAHVKRMRRCGAFARTQQVQCNVRQSRAQQSRTRSHERPHHRRDAAEQFDIYRVAKSSQGVR